MYTCLFTILLPAVLGQIRPDVQFDGENDRFDLTALVQQGAFDQWENFVEAERRAGGSKDNKGYKISARSIMNELRRRHQDRSLRETGHIYRSEQDQHRKTDGKIDLISYLHGRPGDPETRRSAALVDKEVLVHHAVPVKMKIEGVMVPVDDE